MEKDNIKTIFKNKKARFLFEMKKSFFSDKIKYNKILSESSIIRMNTKEEILYILLDKPIFLENEKCYLIKIEIEKNLLKSVGLHQYFSEEKLNIKSARRSYLIDYMYNYDKNISLTLGNIEYI